MDVCCVCCVLAGRVLCDELITRSEDSYRLWRVVVCEHENLVRRGGHSPRWAAQPEKKLDISQKYPSGTPLKHVARRMDAFYEANSHLSLFMRTRLKLEM
jgi:hypothetical protein